MLEWVQRVCARVNGSAMFTDVCACAGWYVYVCVFTCDTLEAVLFGTHICHTSYTLSFSVSVAPMSGGTTV